MLDKFRPSKSPGMVSLIGPAVDRESPGSGQGNHPNRTAEESALGSNSLAMATTGAALSLCTVAATTNGSRMGGTEGAC